jgi:O-antigen ligase
MIGLALTYLLTYGGIVVSLFWPFYGLLIYVAFAIIRPQYIWQESVPEANYSRMVAIAMLIGWVLHGLGKWNFGRAKPVFLAILGYWAWMIVCAFFAPNSTAAWDYVGVRSTVLLPLLMGMTLIRSPRQITQLGWVIVISQGLVAFIANWDIYFNQEAWLRTNGAGLGDNNFAATSIDPVVGLAVFMILQEKILWRKAILIMLSGLMVNAVFFSNSRGGMVGLLAAGMVGFILIPKQPKYYFFFFMVLLVVLRLAGPPVVERFASIYDTSLDPEHGRSAESRLTVWKVAWGETIKNPLVGIGPGHWKVLEESLGQKSSIHSTWFSTGVELGLPGLALLLSLYWLTLWPLWRLMRKAQLEDYWFSSWARGVLSGLVGFMAAGSFITGEYIEQPYYVMLVGIGVLMLLPREEPALEKTNHVEQEPLTALDDSVIP